MMEAWTSSNFTLNNATSIIVFEKQTFQLDGTKQNTIGCCFSKPAFFLWCCLMNLDLIDEEQPGKKMRTG